ncbi:hypothetical protein DPMN_061502 [Dreissena polymorpha]|uniref:Uncharacterized protein n=1 Tax=Dreissena polymorpha TaxID=45954 RepID=A0A9D4C7W1_DREPO|nr:hypothetical protein DPMN_061502 [Dreissena polymorpha]
MTSSVIKSDLKPHQKAKYERDRNCNKSVKDNLLLDLGDLDLEPSTYMPNMKEIQTVTKADLKPHQKHINSDVLHTCLGTRINLLSANFRCQQSTSFVSGRGDINTNCTGIARRQGFE